MDLDGHQENGVVEFFALEKFDKTLSDYRATVTRVGVLENYYSLFFGSF